MKCLICKKRLKRITCEVRVRSFNSKRKYINTILHPICFDCIENLNFRKYKKIKAQKSITPKKARHNIRKTKGSQKK